MRATAFAFAVLTATLASACTPAPGSPEWCKGIENGSIKPTAGELVDHALTCAGHALDGAQTN